MVDAQQTSPNERQETEGATASAGLPAAEVLCHRCGEALTLGTQICPHCGHKQHRQCFCGQAFPSNLTCCPACGTDWTKSVRRRRSRSEKIRPRALMRHALLGAFIAMLAAGLLNVIVTALAQRATPEGSVPAELGARLHYAWYTLATVVARLFTRLIGGLGYALLIAVAGAVVGVLACLLPARLARWTHGHRSDRSRRRRSGRLPR